MTTGKFQELANRLMKLDIFERSEMTNAYTVACVAAENMVRALADLQEDIALFNEMQTPERVLELNKSWEDFAYRAKNTAQMLDDFVKGKHSYEQYRIK